MVSRRSPTVLLGGLLLAAAGTAAASRKATSRPQLDSGERLLAGGSARFGAQMIMYPADALRTLAQTRAGVPQEVIKQRLVTGIYPNFRTAVSTIARVEGPLGFYAGWAPTVSRNLPFVVICFCSFDALQRWMLRDKPDGTALSTVENLAAGVTSALIGGLCTQPIDVVKTRLMTQAAVRGVTPYAGVVDCVRTMLATEGPGVFLAGLAPRMAYMGPLWALQFGLNGVATDAIQTRKERASSVTKKALTEGK